VLAEETEYSLRQMKTVLKADIRPSAAIELSVLKERPPAAMSSLPAKLRRGRGASLASANAAS